jgi:hypothetical protein
MSVFISYSHDSDEHAAKVLALAKRLQGIALMSQSIGSKVARN